MSDYFECTKVGLEFLNETKNVFSAIEIVKATPEQVFDVFENAHSWTSTSPVSESLNVTETSICPAPTENTLLRPAGRER